MCKVGGAGIKNTAFDRFGGNPQEYLVLDAKATENLSLCKEVTIMPEISRFFGIILRMFYDEHNPPHVHAEYSGHKAVLDFRGNILAGDLESKTAMKLIREWIDLHASELERDWELARAEKPLKPIVPLD